MSSTLSEQPSQAKSQPLSSATVATLGLLVCLSALAVDINMPVLPLVAVGLDTPLQVVPLIISYYLAGYALGQIPCGLIADRYGRLPVLYAGLLLFCGASLVSSLATDIQTVLWARFVQGLGGATGPVLARAVIRDLVSGPRMAQLMSVMVAILSLATLVGPILGSLVGALFGWRATFFTGVLIALAGMLMVRLYVVETLPPGAREHSAWRQFSLSCKAFFSNAQCIWASLLVALSFAGFMTIHASIAAIITDVYGYPTIYVGPFFALAVIAYLAAAILNRRWVERLGPLRMLSIAIGTFAVAALLAWLISYFAEAHILVFLAVLTLYMMGIGFILPNASALALEPMPKAAGFAASIMGTLQIGSAALVSSLAAAFYDQSILSLTATMALTGTATVLLYWLGRPWVLRHRRT